MNNTANTHPLQRLWLALTGGQRGCPRRAFFLRYGLCCALVGVLSACFYIPSVPSLVLAGRMDAPELVLAVVGSLSNIFAILAGGLCYDSVFRLGHEYLYPFFADESGGFAADSWQVILGFYLGGPAMLCSALVLCGLAWRRLRDAGRSRWNLLACLVGPAVALLAFLGGQYMDALCSHPLGVWCFGALSRSGDIWLLCLFCLPTRQSENPPAP